LPTLEKDLSYLY